MCLPLDSWGYILDFQKAKTLIISFKTLFLMCRTVLGKQHSISQFLVNEWWAVSEVYYLVPPRVTNLGLSIRLVIDRFRAVIDSVKDFIGGSVECRNYFLSWCSRKKDYVYPVALLTFGTINSTVVRAHWKLKSVLSIIAWGHEL